MNSFCLLLSLAVPGVDYGWHTTPQGLEYIVQVEQQTVGALINTHEKQEVTSKVPPEVGAIHFVRVHLGEGKLETADLSTERLLDVDYGYQPSKDGEGVDFLIQIRPAGLRSFLDGEDVVLPIPAELSGQVRWFRIRVGDEQMPRVAPPAARRTGGEQPADPANAGAGPPAAGSNLGLGGEPPGEFAAPPQMNLPEYGVAPPPRAPLYNANDQAPPPLSAPPRDGSQYTLGGDQAGAGPLAAPPGRTAPAAVASAAATPPGERSVMAPALGGGRPQPVTDPDPKNAAAAPAGYVPRAAARPAAAPASEPAEPEKRWIPLMVTTLALFASLGGNCFLVWVVLRLYDRYRRAITDMREQSRRAARAG